MLELLFLLLPIAAAYGWYMGRRSAQQIKQQEANRLSRDYVAGMTLLLNNQKDKAVDLFLDMLKEDSDTTEAHLTLGSLFRSRGEVDRAIRIHQSLLESASLSYEQRLLAVQQLGRDYLAAGLYDRAETMFSQLVDETEFRQGALRQLSQLYQVTSDWQKAIDVTERLIKTGADEFRMEIAHFYCELALQAIRNEELDRAQTLLKKAINADVNSVRTSVMQGRIFIAKHDYLKAQASLQKVIEQDQDLICETLDMLQECYRQQHNPAGWFNFLRQCVAKNGGASAELLLASLIEQQDGAESAQVFITSQLHQHPTMRLFHQLIGYHIGEAQAGRTKENLILLQDLVGKQIQSKPHYCCQKCGFTSFNLYWRCPSCRSWSSIKPIRGVDGYQ